jgi:hypothetical protein
MHTGRTNLEIRLNGQTIAIITDDRDDGPLMRLHEEIGKKYVILPNKITRKDGNPTGHVVLCNLGRRSKDSASSLLCNEWRSLS